MTSFIVKEALEHALSQCEMLDFCMQPTQYESEGMFIATFFFS